MPLMNTRFLRTLSIALLGLLLLAAWLGGSADRAGAEDQPSVYRMPPKAIADLVDAPPTPTVSVSPDKEWLLLMERPNLPSIAEVSQPELRLAGLRINPRTNGPSRRYQGTGLVLKRVAGGSERRITGLPPDPRIGNVKWSPDGKWIAFTSTRPEGIALFAVGLDDPGARQLTEPCLNGTGGDLFNWMADSETLVVKSVPPGRGQAPEAPEVPEAPVIQETSGKEKPARTFQDLLKNPHDEALMEHYFTSKLMKVRLDRTRTAIGPAGLIARCDPSPDGRYLLVETIHRPYSYLVPIYRFPRRIEVWDSGGELVRRIADLPLAEDVPVGFGAVPTGPRGFGWRSDRPAVLYWVEAQDGGDPRRPSEIRDRVFTLPAPFEETPRPLADLALRYRGVTWGRERLALVEEGWWKTRRSRTWILDPSDPASKPVLLFDRSSEDRYNDPGSPMMARTPAGTYVLLTGGEGRSIFLTGRGASSVGNRPFLDRLDLTTKETVRLWRSEAPYYESAVDFMDPALRRVLTLRESVSEPPNYFLRNLDNGELEQLTRFPHPTPVLTRVKKELIRYQRDDGVQLTAKLYLPPGYAPERDGPLPTLMWAYPREYKSADAAGQVKDSPYQFVRAGWSSPLPWLLHGYAVLDDAALPIIGEGDEEPNDTFVRQLVAGAKAAIDEAARRGVTDPGRVAVGGHSYGAFMTANLLAHSDLFRTGIARSGAYNRTLTPFGFQAEERTFWEAPEIYFEMSPFMHADKVDEPILLIHGAADNNSGTFPMQSERFYNALKGHGATARLVMLPHESHGYRARESVMHMLWEITEWLDRYVKNAPRE